METEDLANDQAFGRYCCLHRRWYILMTAILFTVYGLYNTFVFALEGYRQMFEMHPSRCTGPGCDDTMTCNGTREASYHFRLSVMTIGSVVFGITGIVAIFNRYATEMFVFAWFILATACVYIATAVFDGAYMALCGSQYSYNIMMEAALWPSVFRNWPVTEGVKFELRTMKEYPSGYVNQLAHHNIFTWYVLLYVFRIFLFLLLSYQAFVLAQRFHYGLAGMGANFSIEGWRKRLMLRYEMNEVAYNTFDMAWATGMDMGWTEDEFQLQRPLRQPHWYRGMPGGMRGVVPGAAARAYDGFNDNRRNVLL